MKKIYTVTLEDDIPLSDEVENNLRIICYFLYDNIKEIEEYEGSILYYDNLQNNELLDNFNGIKYKYHFQSEEKPQYWQDYEPFIIPNKFFGFTTNGDTINEDNIMCILANIQSLIGTNYHFNINSYECTKTEGRNKILKALNKEKQETNDNTKRKVRIRTVLSMLKI